MSTRRPSPFDAAFGAGLGVLAAALATLLGAGLAALLDADLAAPARFLAIRSGFLIAPGRRKRAWPEQGPRGDGLTRFHQPRRVARLGVDFEIDVVARLERADRGHLERMRDDQHREIVALDRVHGQRHAVDRDRALGRDVARKLARRAQREARHVGHVLARGNAGEAVDVAGDDVAAEFVADLERAFEIDARAVPPAPDAGDAQSLVGRVDREPGAAILLARVDHGQADARAGDRRALDKFGARIARQDRDAMQVVRPRRDRAYFAEIGDDAGEHQVRPYCARVSTPSFSESSAVM